MTQATRREDGTRSAPSIVRFFDEMSATRNAAFRLNPVLDYEQRVRSGAVLSLVGARRGETILDIGCGNARDIAPILRAGARVIGVDLSEGMIEQATLELAAAGQHGATLQVGDATRLEFADGMFDKIVCSEVIEHIPDAEKAIDEMRRVLKPDGVLVLSTPNRGSWYGFDRYVLWTRVLRRAWNHPFDHWRTGSELRALLDAHGFEITSTRTTCYLPGFILTYFLPRMLQAIVARVVAAIEPVAFRIVPRRGYMLVVTARKKN